MKVKMKILSVLIMLMPLLAGAQAHWDTFNRPNMSYRSSMFRAWISCPDVGKVFDTSGVFVGFSVKDSLKAIVQLYAKTDSLSKEAEAWRGAYVELLRSEMNKWDEMIKKMKRHTK